MQNFYTSYISILTVIAVLIGLQPSCTLKGNRNDLSDSSKDSRRLKENVMLEFEWYDPATQTSGHRICDKDSVYFIFHDGFTHDTVTIEMVGSYNNQVYDSRKFIAQKDTIWNFSIPSTVQGFFRIGINGQHKFRGRIKGEVFNSIKFDLVHFLNESVSNDSDRSTWFEDERTLVITYSTCAYPVGQEPVYINALID